MAEDDKEIRVQCEGMTSEEVDGLMHYLLRPEHGVSTVFREGSRGFANVQEFVINVLGTWATKKALDFAYDRTKRWIKNRRKEQYLITLSIRYGGESREISPP